jgi:hypothetical protein
MLRHPSYKGLRETDRTSEVMASRMARPRRRPRESRLVAVVLPQSTSTLPARRRVSTRRLTAREARAPNRVAAADLRGAGRSRRYRRPRGAAHLTRAGVRTRRRSGRPVRVRPHPSSAARWPILRYDWAGIPKPRGAQSGYCCRRRPLTPPIIPASPTTRYGSFASADPRSARERREEVRSCVEPEALMDRVTGHVHDTDKRPIHPLPDHHLTVRGFGLPFAGGGARAFAAWRVPRWRSDWAPKGFSVDLRVVGTASR